MIASTEAMTDLRLRMMSVAMRILPNVADAEDAVQEAFLRLLKTQDVRSPEGFLVRTTMRRCIDRLREKQFRDKRLGPWTLLSAIAATSRRFPETDDSLCEAFLFMLERLTPRELAAYVLRTVFNFDHVEIAGLLNETEGNARQIFHRARSRIRHSKARFHPSSDEAAKLVDDFVAACRTGNLDPMMWTIIPNIAPGTASVAHLGSRRLPSGYQKITQRPVAQLRCGQAVSRATGHRTSRTSVESSWL